MAIENPILLAVNEIDNISATSEISTLQASNLHNDQPSELWRAASAVDVVFTGSFETVKQISGFGLINHNLDEETVQLELAMDASYLNIVKTETWTAKDPDFGWGEGTFGDLYSTWGGYALDDGGLNDQLIKTFTGVGARYWRVTIAGVATTTPEAGTLFLGAAFQPQIGARRDPDVPVVDPSEVVRTRGQAMRSDNQPTFREISYEYIGLNAEEAMEFKRICRRAGKRKLSLFSLMPGAGSAEEKESKMPCRIIDWSGPARVEASAESLYIAQVTLQEAL